MWDFSWLERRWPGAGYEDWDQALDGLVERGYDAVRIDAFPHLAAAGPTTLWTLKPYWNTQDWGSPALNTVQVVPALHLFMHKCRDRGVEVALSSWFREDVGNTRMTITGPDRLADVWNSTLAGIARAGLLDTLLWVDLANEWPGPGWVPFLQPPLDWGLWDNPRSLAYMAKVIAGVRREHPDLPLLFSTNNVEIDSYAERDIRFMDLIEHHMWMASEHGDEFNTAVGYGYERFSPKGYENIQAKAAALYRSKPAYWQGLLTTKIDRLAVVARRAGKPLATTECWAIVDYKDWPLQPWDWVKEVCAVGTLRAASTGQWAAIATSNFTGPQFVGMWRDVAWHRRMTDAIKSAPMRPELAHGRLWARL